MTRATQGEAPAIDALLERHLPALRAFVRVQAGPLVRAKESCSDLVQSVCREVLQDLGGFRWQGEAAFRQWLFRAALHKVIDRNRHWQQARRDARREAALHDDRASASVGGAGDGTGRLAAVYRTLCTPSRAAAARADIARVEAAFDTLPADWRDVVVRARLLGMSHKEIAAELGKSETSTRQILSRALARLATVLDA